MDKKIICNISLINGKEECVELENIEMDSFIKDVFENQGIGKYKLFTKKIEVMLKMIQ